MMEVMDMKREEIKSCKQNNEIGVEPILVGLLSILSLLLVIYLPFHLLYQISMASSGQRVLGVGSALEHGVRVGIDMRVSDLVEVERETKSKMIETEIIRLEKAI